MSRKLAARVVPLAVRRQLGNKLSGETRNEAADIPRHNDPSANGCTSRGHRNDADQVTCDPHIGGHDGDAFAARGQSRERMRSAALEYDSRPEVCIVAFGIEPATRCE